MSFSRSRAFIGAWLTIFGLVACGGGASAPQVPANSSLSSTATRSQSVAKRVDLTLSPSRTTVDLSKSARGSDTIALRASSATKAVSIEEDEREDDEDPPHRRRACAPSFKIVLVNREDEPVSLDIDGITRRLPCTTSNTLFGVSFYQIKPVPSPTITIKLGDVTVTGSKFSFVPTVTSVTLAPKSKSAIVAYPEESATTAVVPIVAGTNQVLTSNAPTLPSSLVINYPNVAGGGTLYTSTCALAKVDGVLAPALAGAIIEGIPSFYCAIGTVDSNTVTFGSTVTFTIGAPIPDRSFIALDGPPSEFPCDTSVSPVCVTPQFTVPTITNVIAGNVLDLQVCAPARENQNCNSNNSSGTPAAAKTSIKARSTVQLLVADDPTYIAPTPASATCSALTVASPSAAAICGGFIVDTNAGCTIDLGSDNNGDVPLSGMPPYRDPGASAGSTATHAVFLGVGPDVELDLIAGAAGTTCNVTVTEADGPLKRPVTLALPVI